MKGIDMVSQALKSLDKAAEISFDLDPQVIKNDGMSEDKTTQFSYLKASGQ